MAARGDNTTPSRADDNDDTPSATRPLAPTRAKFGRRTVARWRFPYLRNLPPSRPARARAFGSGPACAQPRSVTGEAWTWRCSDPTPATAMPPPLSAPGQVRTRKGSLHGGVFDEGIYTAGFTLPAWASTRRRLARGRDARRRRWRRPWGGGTDSERQGRGRAAGARGTPEANGRPDHEGRAGGPRRGGRTDGPADGRAATRDEGRRTDGGRTGGRWTSVRTSGRTSAGDSKGKPTLALFSMRGRHTRGRRWRSRKLGGRGGRSARWRRTHRRGRGRRRARLRRNMYGKGWTR